MRVVTDPVVTKSQDYPTTSSKPPHSTTAKDGKGKGKEREIETASEGARSRSSSGSSFEGLTARLQGARQGKKRSVEKRDDAEENDDSEGKSGDRVKHVQEEEEESFYNQRQTELSSVPTISLSVDQVEIQHGETKVVTPDLSEPPPPLSVPTPIDSPVLSAHSSNFDSRPPPPHRIKINENEPDDDKGPSATTFASSPSLSELSDAGDDDDEGGRSESESEPESVNLVSRSESQQDPRELLRSQLAKAGTGRQEGRTGEEIREEQEAEQKIRVAMNRTASGISQRSHTGMEKEMGPGKEIKVYDKRRYFILSTAGKLIYTS
ncbi:uncharacterized protein JCM6883_000181 [Sporobolomyces salmoneus]|uniref:uncharacterized protein n=1 Tax=Sporobolomyces salmoneus TaxID=183962 RepID=UPI003170740D